MKNGNTIRRYLKFFILFVVAFVFSFCAAGGPKGGGSDSSGSGSAAIDGNSDVDSVKQAAETAEWEAHRLREELFRKQQSSPTN